MGSRKQNFYNALVRRYGFEEAAQEVQDLYLGREGRGRGALPAELIDMTSLCGPADRVRERLEVYREAGVGTLITSPVAFDPDERKRMIRELAGMVRAAATSSPRSATPATPSPPSPSAASWRPGATRSCCRPWRRWEADVEREGMRFAAAGYEVFPTREKPLKPYVAAVRGAGDGAAGRSFEPDAVVADILTVAAAMAAETEDRPWVTLIPHVLPMFETGLPPYSVGAVRPRTAGTPAVVARAAAADGRGATRRARG